MKTNGPGPPFCGSMSLSFYSSFGYRHSGPAERQCFHVTEISVFSRNVLSYFREPYSRLDVAKWPNLIGVRNSNVISQESVSEFVIRRGNSTMCEVMSFARVESLVNGEKP